MTTRYNVALGDGCLPVLSFAEDALVTSVRLPEDGALVLYRPGGVHVLVGSGTCDKVPSTEDLFGSSAGREVLAPLFEVCTNPEVPLAEGTAERRASMVTDGLNRVSETIEEVVEGACAAFAARHGAAPAVVVLFVRTSPVFLAADDPRNPSGSTVGYSVFANVGVMACSLVPEQAATWAPAGRFMAEVPPGLTVEAVRGMRVFGRSGTLSAPPVLEDVSCL
jgi:hypothetical protein